MSRFTQVIRTVISLVPGGVLRYAKEGPDDDEHVGFWLGVGADKVARFSVGGPDFWLKWTGTELLVRGRLSTLGGDGVDERVHWVGADGKDIAYLMAVDGWGHQLEIGTPRQDAAGDPSAITLRCDGDLDGLVRLVLWTVRGAGQAGAHITMEIGNGNEVFRVEGRAGAAWIKGPVNCADPAEDSHAVTRRAGDGRYVCKSAGWSGTFRTDEIASVTVVDGQITAVV